MWRKLTLALVVVPLGVILVALAVVNRKPVELVLDPFGGAAPNFSLQAPLFLLLARRVCRGPHRRRHRHLARPRQMAARGREETRQARDWRRQADRLEKELEGYSPAASRPRLTAD